MNVNEKLAAKWLICRICLKSDNKKLYNIFEPIVECEFEDLGSILLDKIELFGAIKLRQQCNLPNKICNGCVLLLRAAYKFRDLCHQSQNQLKQFMETVPQKEENERDTIEYSNKHLDQIKDVQNEIASEELTDAEYVGEENMGEYNESSYPIEESPTNDNDYTSCAENDMEVHELNDFENAQYIIEEVDSQEYENRENEERTTIYNCDRDINDEDIIFEEVSKKTERQSISKRIIESKSALKRKRKQSHTDNAVYNCEFCDNTYTDKPKYNNHLKIHANDKPHECEICKKRFSTTPQLSRHMNSHTGNRPYKCRYCVASFGDPSTKIKHERIHTNERPYKCDICNKAFAYSNVLKVHIMTHTGEKPHTCEYCGKNFSQMHHKNAHEKRHATINMVYLQNSPEDEYIEEDLKEYKIEKII